MSLTPEGWHQRYLQQAGWTAPIRKYLLEQYSPTGKPCRLLEVGCGTGAVLGNLPLPGQANLYGMDINITNLSIARQVAPFARLAAANAYRLPFPNGSFEITCCHFLLLWLQSPFDALLEMVRVTQPGGVVIAFAEPDYGGRIDHPASLVQLGVAQTRALIRQGANPYMGRTLAGLWNRAGLESIRVGVLGAAWSFPLNSDALEWQVLQDDLQGEFSIDSFTQLFEEERASSQIGERILFLPTFYAAGVTPKP